MYTDPDRIVLGPPRRSFASSTARATDKKLDALEDKAKSGDGPDSQTRERRSTQTNGRHNRHESDDQGLDTRRDYDRKLRWGRDKNEQQELEDDQALEDSRPGFRRDTVSRAKMSQSWFRKDGGEPLEENRRDTDKAPDWRTRARERDWDRSLKPEADPEWMDSTEPEEPFQAHTQQDFQRWKERMKAGGAPQEQSEPIISDSPVAITEDKTSQKIASPEPDDSMDKFFARYEQKTVTQKSAPGKSAGTKTRFASLFSPSAEQSKPFENMAPVATERPASAQMPNSSPMDADQAGFARILEMLQTRSNNPTPQTQEQTKPRTPLYARDVQPKMEGEARPPSSSNPNLLSFLGNQNAGYSQEPAPSQERYTDSKSPADQHSHTRQQSSINKDEVLLNLLRQANLAPKPQPPPPHQHSELRSAGVMYGGPDPSARQGPPRSQIPSQAQEQAMNQRRETGRSMFDEPPVPMYHGEPGSREQLSRRLTNGPQPSYNDDPLMALLRSQNQGQQRMMQQSQGQGVPPGLQRPPGLDQMPRQNPSWPPQQPQAPPQAQQQPPRQPPLPPGLANMPRGMPGAPYGQPQQLTSPPNIPPPPAQRPPPQRKYTGESPSGTGMPNFPPGMVPPPGFMNAGPPPGFPGAPGVVYSGRYQGEPPQAGRGAFMDMYGDMGGRGVGLRGGGSNGGMPQQYR